MGCGCGKRPKVAVTSANDAELSTQRENEEQLRRDMESLVAAVHNASSETVSTSATSPSL